MNKKLLSVILAGCLLLGYVIYLYYFKPKAEITQNTSNKITDKSAPCCINIAYRAGDLNNLISQSQMIVDGTLGDVYKEYYYSRMVFTEFYFNIDHVYKGDYTGKQIKILQTGTPERAKNAVPDDEIVEYDTLLSTPKGTKLLLFLGEGSNPFTDDKISIVPIGLYHGVYKIEANGKLINTMSDALRKIFSNSLEIKEIENNYDINTIKAKLMNKN